MLSAVVENLIQTARDNFLPSPNSSLRRPWASSAAKSPMDLAVDKDLRHRGDMGALDHLALPDFILGDVDILETGAFFLQQSQGGATVRAPGLVIDLDLGSHLIGGG